MTFTLRTFSIAALVALPLLHGCGGGSGSNSTASVRLVNATAEYDSLDLYRSTNAISTKAAPYKAGSYGGVDSGSQALTLQSSGTTAVTPVSNTYSLSGDTSYAVVAYIAPSGSLTSGLLQESETAPDSGKAKVRIWNTVSYTPAGSTTAIDSFDAYVTQGDCTALLPSGATAHVTDVRAAVKTNQVAATSTGTVYNICITGTGDRTDLRLAVPSVTLKDQQITTLMLTTTPGGVLVNGVQIDQRGDITARTNTLARVRLVADAAGGASVTASIASTGSATATSLATAQPSPNVGPYVLVPAGRLTPSVQIGIGGATVATTSFQADPGADFTLLVTGTSDVTAIPDVNKPSTIPANPVKVRFVNGLNGYNGLASLQVGATLVANGVTFRAASTPSTLPSGTVGLVQASVPGLTPSTVLLPGSDNLSLLAGRVYSVFLLGDAAAPTPTLRLDH